MSDLDRTDMEKICKELFLEFQGILSWVWDSRLRTVLAKFSVDIEDSVRETLEHYFSMTWHTANIGRSPEFLRFVNTRLGGLRKGQLFFTSEPTIEGFTYCVHGGLGGTERPSQFVSHHSIIS